jgi:hypothetical protein
MCLVERSRFGLNDLLGRKVSEIEPVGRVAHPMCCPKSLFPSESPDGRAPPGEPACEPVRCDDVSDCGREREDTWAPPENRETMLAVAENRPDAGEQKPGQARDVTMPRNKTQQKLLAA